MKYFINGNLFQDLHRLKLKKIYKFIRDYFKKIKEFSMIREEHYSIFSRNMGNNLSNVSKLIQIF